MPKRITQEVHRNKRYRVVARRIVPAPVEPQLPAITSPRPHERPDTWGETRFRPYEGGTEIVTAPRVTGADPTDLANRFAPIRLETGPVATPFQVTEVRERLLAQADLPVPPRRYLYSDREYYGKIAPLWANEEISGYNGIFSLKRRATNGELEADRIQRIWAMQHNAPWAGKMKTGAEQLALWDSLEPPANNPTHAQWLATRETIAKLQLEKWDNETGGRGAKDLTIRATGCTPGLWAPSFNGADHYYSWDTENTDLYTTSRAPWTSGTQAPVWCASGEGQSTNVRAFLEPQRHQYFFRWVSIYVIIIFFSPPIFIAEINTSAMADRLPLGYKYVSDPSSVLNGVAISNWIQQSNRYAVAILQDVGAQIFSAFFYKLLVGRVDGMWALHRGNQNAGDLAAILDMERGERSDRYHVFRKTFQAGGEIFNFGPLGTQEVVPMDPSRGAQFQGTYNYGGF